MKKLIKLVAAVLCIAMLLTGCVNEDVSQIANALKDAMDADTSDIAEGLKDAVNKGSVTFQDMAYARPDMDKLEGVLSDAIAAAEGEEFSHIIDMIYAFYDEYDAFYTNYNLADIHYCHDLTDTYWEAEYNFCAENSARVDAALEELYYALAQSPCRDKLETPQYFGEGYFASYDGENLWDEAFVELLNQEAELQTRYYELANVGAEYEEGSEAYYAACGNEMAQLMVELIRLRQEIAGYWGYDSYPEFAVDFYHYRDYTVAQSRDYMESVRDELVDIYREVNLSGIWDNGFLPCREEDTYEYVKTLARNMGGMVEEAFDVMDERGLYDISYGANKYPSSFEVYLTSYSVPFVFMNPEGSTYDYLTFAHEFGHFCNDYASYGSYVGVDVLEFFSQGLEYLSLCYGEGADHLVRMKMADSLCLYVEQSAFATFEIRMYELTGEDLTVENLAELYEKTALEFGFDSVGYEPLEFVSINHFYTSPMYIISYVVSNDAAMQLYQMEQAHPGDGRACYEENLDTEEAYFLAFLESTGMESPFAEGRIQSVRETFEDILG